MAKTKIDTRWATWIIFALVILCPSLNSYQRKKVAYFAQVPNQPRLSSKQPRGGPDPSRASTASAASEIPEFIPPVLQYLTPSMYCTV